MFKKLRNKFRKSYPKPMIIKKDIEETGEYNSLTERQFSEVDNLFKGFTREYVGEGNDKKPVDKKKLFSDFAIQNETRLNNIKPDLADDFYRNKFAYILDTDFAMKRHNHLLQKKYTQEVDSSRLIKTLKRLTLSELIEWGTKEAEIDECNRQFRTEDTSDGMPGYVYFDENKNIQKSGNVKNDAIFNIESTTTFNNELKFDKVMAVSYNSDHYMDGDGTRANIHSDVTLDELIDVYSGLLREVYHIQNDGEVTLLWHNSGTKPMMDVDAYDGGLSSRTLLNVKTNMLETHTLDYWNKFLKLKERKIMGDSEYYLFFEPTRRLCEIYGYEKLYIDNII